MISNQLTATQRGELDRLLTSFAGVMSDKPGQKDLVQHKIVTKEPRAVRLPPYRQAHAYQPIVQEEIREMLQAGIIEPSTS